MSDNQRIRHIDAWRLIAVSLVIQSHFLIFSNFSFLVLNFPFLRRLGRFGELGVLIFFFISGFVICRGLIDEQAAKFGVSLKAFYVRRVLRILPPLYLYLAALAVLTLWAGGASLTSRLRKSPSQVYFYATWIFRAVAHGLQGTPGAWPTKSSST